MPRTVSRHPTRLHRAQLRSNPFISAQGGGNTFVPLGWPDDYLTKKKGSHSALQHIPIDYRDSCMAELVFTLYALAKKQTQEPYSVNKLSQTDWEYFNKRLNNLADKILDYPVAVNASFAGQLSLLYEFMIHAVETMYENAAENAINAISAIDRRLAKEIKGVRTGIDQRAFVHFPPKINGTSMADIKDTNEYMVESIKNTLTNITVWWVELSFDQYKLFGYELPGNAGSSPVFLWVRRNRLPIIMSEVGADPRFAEERKQAAEEAAQRAAQQAAQQAVQQAAAATETANLLAALDELGELDDLDDGSPRKNPGYFAKRGKHSFSYHTDPPPKPNARTGEYEYIIPTAEMNGILTNYFGACFVLAHRAGTGKVEAEARLEIQELVRASVKGLKADFSFDGVYQLMEYALSNLMYNADAGVVLSQIDDVDDLMARRFGLQSLATSHSSNKEDVVLREVADIIAASVVWWVDAILPRYDELERTNSIPKFINKAELYKMFGRATADQQATKQAAQQAVQQSSQQAATETANLLAALDELGELGDLD